MVVFVLLGAVAVIAFLAGVYVGYKFGAAAVQKALQLEASARLVQADVKKAL